MSVIQYHISCTVWYIYLVLVYFTSQTITSKLYCFCFPHLSLTYGVAHMSERAENFFICPESFELNLSQYGCALLTPGDMVCRFIHAHGRWPIYARAGPEPSKCRREAVTAALRKGREGESETERERDGERDRGSMLICFAVNQRRCGLVTAHVAQH